MVKDILFRAAKRLELTVTLVANHPIPIPKSRFIEAIRVAGGFDVADNIRERLNMRDFMDTLRGIGVDTGGPPALTQTDRRNFANQLDRLLVKLAAGKHL